MPCTPWRSTSSATRNASTIEVCLSSTDSSRLFGTTISVSTSSASASIPASAWCARRVPSKPNGLVTMPTVSAPTSRAIRATTGAAPVPVPPPSPAVMKTMSAPFEQRLDLVVLLDRGLPAELGVGARAEAARDLRADVERDVGACDCCSDWRSVLIAMNSTPAMLGLDHPVDGVHAGRRRRRRRAGAAADEQRRADRLVRQLARRRRSAVHGGACARGCRRKLGAEGRAQPLLGSRHGRRALARASAGRCGTPLWRGWRGGARRRAG